MTLDLVILIGDTTDVTEVVGGDEQPETFKMIKNHSIIIT